jgi:hypothetical protein
MNSSAGVSGRAWRAGILTMAAGAVIGLAAFQPAQAASPLTGTFGQIDAVAATSSIDAWAVGYSENSAGTTFGSLIEHWNGTSWTRKAIPSRCKGGEIRSVAAPSSSNAWATCGKYILHWNGTSWSVAFTSQVGGFNAVAARSTTNAWAVGSTSNFFTLTEHWNGVKWSRIKSPNPRDGNIPNHATLISVTVTSATSAWATGYGINCETSSCTSWSLLHWNGTSWSRPKFPNLGILSGVSASKASRAWAVSQGFFSATLHKYVPGIIHWNGTSWTRSKAPSPAGSSVPGLNGVTARPATAWAVGSWGPKGDCQSFTNCKGLIEHWNGTSWSVSASPDPANSNSILYGVTATGASNAWAGGQSCDINGCHVLMEHWNGTTWSIA